MSDHRFGLKIWFSIYGKEFEWEPSLNWNQADGDVDGRIIDWFAECYAEARADWDAENDHEEKRRAAAKREKTERAELARLKAIYEPDKQGDAAASTEDFDRTVELGSDWYTDTDNQVISWGRMSLPDGEYGVRWHGATPAGDFTVTGITCRVCGHQVAMKRGDVINRGDPRLCEHLGGPGWTGGFGMKAEESSPDEIATVSDDEVGHGYWEKGDY